MQLGLPFGMRYQYVKFIYLVGQNRVSDLIGNQIRGGFFLQPEMLLWRTGDEGIGSFPSTFA